MIVIIATSLLKLMTQEHFINFHDSSYLIGRKSDKVRISQHGFINFTKTSPRKMSSVEFINKVNYKHLLIVVIYLVFRSELGIITATAILRRCVKAVTSPHLLQGIRIFKIVKRKLFTNKLYCEFSALEVKEAPSGSVCKEITYQATHTTVLLIVCCGCQNCHPLMAG